MLSLRPAAADFVFQLYGRSLHPELFSIVQQRTVSRGEYEATICITASGHFVTWRCAGLTMTEVATGAQTPLPQKRRLMSYRVKGERTDRVECRGGASYQVNFQLEPVDPVVFWTLQEELAQDGERRGMLHRFAPGDRMTLGPVSYVHVETRSRSLLVQAFHTFPDDCAIVKTQSLFETP